MTPKLQNNFRDRVMSALSAFLDVQCKMSATCLAPMARHREIRNFDIFREFLNGKSMSKLAKEYDLTPERIRQIVNLKTSSFEKDLLKFSNLLDIKKKYVQLVSQYTLLSSQYDALKEADDAERQQLPEILSERVTALGLSARVRHCLDKAKIEYMWQLVPRNRMEMLKLRNFGLTCLHELDNLLKKHGLNWEMDITHYALPHRARNTDAPVSCNSCSVPAS